MMTLLVLMAGFFGLIIMLDIVFTLYSIRNSLKYIEKCAAWIMKVSEAKKAATK